MPQSKFAHSVIPAVCAGAALMFAQLAGFALLSQADERLATAVAGNDGYCDEALAVPHIVPAKLEIAL